MLQSRLEHGLGCPWCLRAQVLAASWPIHFHPSLRWCPGAVVNPSAGQPTNPWALMGRRGIFSLYPFLPVGAFGPFIARRIPRGVEPGAGERTSIWDRAT
jgi:hypothetical protein